MTVLQAFDANYRDWFDETSPAVKAWAEANGDEYTFRLYNTGHHPYAYKFLALAEVLAQPTTKPVLYLDVDIVPREWRQIRLPVPVRDVMVSQDDHGLCLGAMLVHPTPWVKAWVRFMAETIPDEPRWRTEDQAIAKALYAIPACNARIGVLPTSEISHPLDPHPHAVLHHLWANQAKLEFGWKMAGKFLQAGSKQANP